MAYFNFSRLIKKYSSNFTVILPAAGSYNDSGEYVSGEPQMLNLRGAILGLRETKIYNSNGVLTSKDRTLFVEQELTDNLIGAKAVYKNNLYSIEENSGNFEFTGFTVYTLKFISVFDSEVVTND